MQSNGYHNVTTTLILVGFTIVFFSLEVSQNKLNFILSVRAIWGDVSAEG